MFRNKKELMLAIREKELMLAIREKELMLEKENFEREKSNIEKEISLKYQFDKKALEDEWHCKLGNHIEQAIKVERDKVHELLKEVISLVEKIKHSESKIEIIK